MALFEDKLNLKLPGGAGFPWHQDWSCCWRASTDELVTCFVVLDDATEENGPLEMIPGSHRGAICLPFRSDAENMHDPAFAAKTEGFEVDPRVHRAERVVRAPLGAGDMIVFDPYLLHSSDRNQPTARGGRSSTPITPSAWSLYEYRETVARRAEAAARVRAHRVPAASAN